MRVLRGHTGAVRCLAYAPDGTLASGGEDGEIRLWQVAGEPLGKPLRHKGSSVKVLSFLAGGKYLAAGLGDGRLVLWGAARWTKAVEEQAHSWGVRCLSVAPDGQSLLTAGWDRKLARWDLQAPVRGKPTLKRTDLENCDSMESDGEVEVAALAHAPDGGLFLGIGWEGDINAFDFAAGIWSEEKLAEASGFLDPEGAGLRACAWAPGGALAIALGKTIVLWRSLKAEKELADDMPPVTSLAFAPDGRLLVSGGLDGTVRTWDVGSGRVLHVYRWHEGVVNAVAVAPDGMTASSCGEDGAVVVWDLAEG